MIAEIFSLERSDRTMEDLLSRLNIELSVTAVSWEKASSAGN